MIQNFLWKTTKSTRDTESVYPRWKQRGLHKKGNVLCWWLQSDAVGEHYWYIRKESNL